MFKVVVYVAVLDVCRCIKLRNEFFCLDQTGDFLDIHTYVHALCVCMACANCSTQLSNDRGKKGTDWDIGVVETHEAQTGHPPGQESLVGLVPQGIWVARTTDIYSVYICPLVLVGIQINIDGTVVPRTELMSRPEQQALVLQQQQSRKKTDFSQSARPRSCMHVRIV